MPIREYGVWVAYPISYEAERGADDGQSPHISLFFNETADAGQGRNKAAINVKSVTSESRLVYWFVRDFRAPILDNLQGLDVGFHALPSSERGGLDYIRGNLMTFEQGTLVRHDVEGRDNDIIDYMSPILDQAIAAKAKVYLFGEPFPNGIHDVHMNQGNEGKFKRDNGVWQDGGIVFQFPDGHFEAIFLAFAVQKIHTDDSTGNAVGTVDFAALLTGSRATPRPQPQPQPTPTPQGPTDGDAPEQPQPQPVLDGAVIIRAALINPIGPDQATEDQPETVYLHNKTSSPIKLDGWTVVNRQGQTQDLDGVVPALGDKAVLVARCPLSNKGGTISVLDSAGLKVDGVSYTAGQVRREGVLLYFH